MGWLAPHQDPPLVCDSFCGEYHHIYPDCVSCLQRDVHVLALILSVEALLVLATEEVF